MKTSIISKRVTTTIWNYSLKSNFLISYINGRHFQSFRFWRSFIKTKKVYGLEKYRKPNSDFFYFETESYQDQVNSTSEDGTRAPLGFPVTSPLKSNNQPISYIYYQGSVDGLKPNRREYLEPKVKNEYNPLQTFDEYNNNLPEYLQNLNQKEINKDLLNPNQLKHTKTRQINPVEEIRKRHKLNEEIKQVYRNKPLHERLGLNLKIKPNEKITNNPFNIKWRPNEKDKIDKELRQRAINIVEAEKCSH